MPGRIISDVEPRQRRIETGEVSEAREIAAEIKRLDPGFRIGQFLKKQPFQDQATGQKYAARLREIGLQD